MLFKLIEDYKIAFTIKAVMLCEGVEYMGCDIQSTKLLKYLLF